MTTNKVRPIGWVNTVFHVKDAWNGIMTIQHSPLRKLDPRVAHMIFQMLAFMWSGIFAVMISSYMAFGISAIFHVVFISGVFITSVVMNQADNNPETLNSAFKVKKGYHTTSRTRQNMWINGEKVELDPKDPGGEHE